MYNDIKLEKGLYNLSGKSFTSALEELDPDISYSGTPLAGLDAYERQLRRFNIKVKGQESDKVEKFFSSTETAVLFPEFVTRSIRKGFDDTVLSAICAVKTVCDSGQYLGCVLDDTVAYGSVSQTSELPASTIKEGTNPLVLEKFGRIINASYESIRSQRIDVFGVMLRSIGVKLANTVIKKSFGILSSVTESVTTTSLTYADLAKLYGSFNCFEMTSIIVSPKIASEIASMSQLADAKISEDGRMMLPFGCEIIKSSSADDNTIVGIDKNFALEFITSSDLIMETDRLIDRQLDKMSVSITCGFRKITPDAIKVLKINA